MCGKIFFLLLVVIVNNNNNNNKIVVVHYVINDVACNIKSIINLNLNYYIYNIL